MYERCVSVSKGSNVLMFLLPGLASSCLVSGSGTLCVCSESDLDGLLLFGVYIRPGSGLWSGLWSDRFPDLMSLVVSAGSSCQDDIM